MTTISTDQPSYLPGDIVDVTMVYEGRVHTITGHDQDGRPGTATFRVGEGTLTSVVPPLPVTKVDDNGATATFTIQA